MKNKIFIIANLALSLVLLVVLSGFIFGWYVRTDQEEPVDVVTNGIVLTYTFDDDTTVNPETYDVDNLVFFDLDNEGEGKYFSTMAVMMEISIENRSKANVDITVKQGTTFTYSEASVAANETVPEGQYYELSGTEYSLTTDTKFSATKTYYLRDPYVATAVSQEELDSSDEVGSVADFLGNDLMTTSTVENVSALNEATNEGGKATFYVYIYGIQPYDASSNEFLGSYDDKASYTFSLILSAIATSSEEVTTTTE